jgi:hypothetical protein
MNPASKDIADFLNAAGLSLTLGTDLFYSRMPDSPSDCVSVMDNPGDSPMLTFQKSTSNFYSSSVCVYVRDVDYATGWAKIFSIQTYLHGLGQLLSIDHTAHYGVIKSMNDPQVLYWDEKERVVFIINFDIKRKPN